jgi:hypothetical protein
VSEHLLDALERRGDERVRWYEANRQAQDWIAKNGTQALVDELAEAFAEHRMVRLGTINTIVLMEHISRLEAELVKPPLVKP